MIILLTLVFVPVQAVIYGLTLTKLWDWFVSGYFHQVPSLSVAEAIGLGYVVTYLTYAPDFGKRDDVPLRQQLWAGFIFTIIRAALALLLGFVVHSFQ